MKNLLIVLLTLVLLLTSRADHCFALDPATELAGSEISDLTASIQRLADMVERQAADQAEESVYRKLDLAIAYLNFRSRRIEMIERDLQSAKNTRERMEDILREWEQREEDLENEIRSNTQGSNSELEMAKRDSELRRKSMQQRLSRVESEMITLENRIMELQTQIDTVESFVQKNLKL